VKLARVGGQESWRPVVRAGKFYVLPHATELRVAWVKRIVRCLVGDVPLVLVCFHVLQGAGLLESQTFAANRILRADGWMQPNCKGQLTCVTRGLIWSASHDPLYCNPYFLMNSHFAK
jgi:hypothetical protein